MVLLLVNDAGYILVDARLAVGMPKGRSLFSISSLAKMGFALDMATEGDAEMSWLDMQLRRIHKERPRLWRLAI